MHNVLQDYYHQEPQNRFSHIPSVVLTVRANLSTQHDLCFWSRYLKGDLEVSAADVRATAKALLHAVQELESDSDAQTIQQSNQDKTTKPVRKFFVKRNYSGESLLQTPALCSIVQANSRRSYRHDSIDVKCHSNTL